MAVEFVNFAKEVADTRTAQTQAERGQFELESEKKAYSDRQAESKGMYDIFSKMGAQEQKAPPKETAGPGGYDPETGTTGEDREKAVNFKNMMAANQQESQSISQQAKQLQALMLNAAKNNDPELALKFRAELDGLGDKAMKSQTDKLTLMGKQAEFKGQLAYKYKSNPTEDTW